MPTAAKPKAKAKAKAKASKAKARKTAAGKPKAAAKTAAEPGTVDGHKPPAPGPDSDHSPSADPPTLELDGQRDTLEAQGAKLIQDKQAQEPEIAIGGAELAGAQINQLERDPMVATGTTE